MQRGWDRLARFAERLANFPRAQVRAVATQTLREARNSNVFLQRGSEVLGHPIDVVSGLEEARLIYQGCRTTASPIGRATPGCRYRWPVDRAHSGTQFSAQAVASFHVGSGLVHPVFQTMDN